MVAAAQLSPDDARRITDFFSRGRSILALAASSGAPLAELLDWLGLPHIHHAIDAIARCEDQAHQAAALSALRQLLDTSEDPIEKRRAATAILRTLRRASRAKDPAGWHGQLTTGGPPATARATGGLPASATTSPDPFPTPSPDLPRDNSPAGPPASARAPGALLANARATGGLPASATASTTLPAGTQHTARGTRNSELGTRHPLSTHHPSRSTQHPAPSTQLARPPP